MGILVWIAVFFLGMALAVQVVAALYGFIDLRFAGWTERLRVLWRCLLWSGLCTIVAALLSRHLREAFVWGIAVYPIFYAGSHLALNLFLSRNAKQLEEETPESHAGRR